MERKKAMKIPPRLTKGDKVAILSPSAGLPSIFPHVYELGLKRVEEVFGLEAVEFPSARKSPGFLAANPQARADDINAAFSDPSIKAIIATIGGNDQVRILPYLDQKLIAAHPKIFLGYSDNTNLHLQLWNWGMVSYYGANLMTQFAMQGKMHDYTVRSIRKALFESSIGEIHPSSEWTDEDLPWDDPGNLQKKRTLYPNAGWDWHQHEGKEVEGILWGGCLEVLEQHLAIRHYLPAPEKLSDAVLFLETSEEMPSEGFVYRFFLSLAELGLLQKFKAILIGRPKTQFCGKFPSEGRELFIAHQKQAIKRALKDTHSDALTIFNVDFGHTDPQLLLPSGGKVLINGSEKKLFLIDRMLSFIENGVENE